MQPSPTHPIAAVRSGEDLTFANLVGIADRAVASGYR